MYRRVRGLERSDDASSLRRAEILSTLPDNILAHLAAHSRSVASPKGGTIYLPGDAPGLYVLARGRVAILSQPTPEVEVQVSLRRPNELFGETAPYAAAHVDQARALEPVRATRIEAAAVRAALEDNPPAASAYAALLARRLSAAYERVAEFGVHAVVDRLFLLLSHLARDCRVADSRGALIPYHLTQDELGRLIGASRVAVNHALRRLGEQGRITMSDRRIIVHGI